jgi:TonB family protein
MNLFPGQVMKPILAIAALVVAAAAVPRAQDPLSAAKDLYASAAYEDALSTLSRIDADSTAPDVARQADEYRAFCLYALGRTGEAESLAEAIVRKHPLARLEAVDASPRLEAMFAEVRKRLLPSLIRERFRSARGAIDAKNFAAAEPSLTDAQLMIGEAEKLGIKDDGLGDLRVLVDGFLGLIQSASASRAAQTVAEAAPAASPVASGSPVSRPPAGRPAASPVSRPVSATATAPASGSRSADAAPATDRGRVYTLGDVGVTPPLTIEQRMPPMPLQLQAIARAVHARGVLDVLIDESGRVADVTIKQSLNPAFDPIVLHSARDWKYDPAVKDGVPVRFVKTIMLVP